MTLKEINVLMDKGLGTHLGIELLELGDNFLKGRMPVDHRTLQPMGLLHGGASCAFAETLVGYASNLCVNMNHTKVLGIEINANHIRSVTNGFVYGTARPIHIGKSTMVWEVRIEDEDKNLVCVSRMTLAVVKV